MPFGTRSQGSYLKINGRRVEVKPARFKGGKEPRLRFDRTAVGFIKRLQASLAEAVPGGQTVIVTITAPIRQDSKTGAALEDRIRTLLAARRSQLRATIFGNRVQVHVLKGGASRTSKLIGFVHNPERNPFLLFDLTRFLLACIGSNKRGHRGGRWLVIAHKNEAAPIETLRQVCLALRARTVFKRILLVSSNGVRAL